MNWVCRRDGAVCALVKAHDWHWMPCVALPHWCWFKPQVGRSLVYTRCRAYLGAVQPARFPRPPTAQS